MSTLSSDDHLSPRDPLYYAPRRLREKPQRSAFSFEEARSDSFAEARSERLKRPASPSPAYDSLLEDAVAQALRRPLEPEVVHEPPGFANERNQRKATLRVVVGSAAAIGVAAVAAFAVVIMVPVTPDHAQHADAAASSISVVANSAQAASVPARQSAGDPTPDVSEFQAILASSRTEAPAVTHEQSETLLQKFLQWQRKPTETH